ncbi:hypothetical protein PRIPAC_75148 [Pristionchus pacificus]|uniref:CUB domain-containing protein n=1 Tax=Pristionchus pacificus TaxID=54126 RepID=A0A454Y3V8_PRIPA|nr:hypothetical protein PRIPAC_75148 [Pristionchus pacificus]|eukprot:PDM83711.1 CUB domain-containing protein [Pristionchus pacificus]
MYSPNYPVSIPAQQTCEYILEVNEGSRVKVKASVIVHTFNCQQGTSLALYDGNDAQPIITFSSNTPPPPPTQAYTAKSKILTIIFSANGSYEPVGTEWEAEFTGK